MPGPIGYTYRFIKQQLDKRKAGPQPDDAKAGSADGDAGAGSAPSTLVDEEAVGRAGAPELSGVPRDPAHARSKRLSMRAIVALGFGLAIDFSMSLMSIQPLYYTMGGPDSAYGFTFGSYDLTALLCAPLFGVWTDRTRRFKPQMLLGALANGAGNLVYAFTVLANRWWMMVIARLVAGVGAATLGIGSSYITQTTSAARRQVALGRYRITQNVARMVGPFVGYLFIGLPNVTSNSSTALQLFNWYTVPGWAAFALVTVLGAFFWWAFTDPSWENEHLVKPEARDDGAGPPPPARVARFRAFTAAWLLLAFFSVFASTGFTANLFALFAGQYHALDSQGDNWKTYIGVGCGAMAAGILFRRMIRLCPQVWEERKLSLMTNWLLVVIWLLVIPYKGATWVPPKALFYVATTLSGFVVVINQTSIETVFSKKVSQYGDVAGDHVGKLMGAFFMAASAGRFAGPLVIGGVTRIATPDGQVGFCTEWTTGPDGAPDCAGPPDQQCVITGDHYWVQGCVLLHAIPMYAAMAGLQFVLCLGFHWVLGRNWSYDNPDLPPPAGKGQGGDAAAADDGKAAPGGAMRSDDSGGLF